MNIDYLKKILTARVYDVASETPLELAPNLSQRIGNQIYFKREDMQSVFSFKVRGAYNKMAHLSEAQLKRGVICASAGNHAQGVALSAARLGCRALIVMPTTTPPLKIEAVRARGGSSVEIVLHGDSYTDAYNHALTLEQEQKLTFVHPFDDPDVIAGQGTIGMEILRQHAGPIHAIFIAIGGGGLIAGVAAYVKQIRPDIRIIGVQTVDSDAMARSLKAKERVTLPDVGLFSDGTAVRLVGEETFRLAQQYVDEVIIVDTDAICAAIKDVFTDTRSILEPAGALAIAGAKAYVERASLTKHPIVNQTLVTIACGANMNFDRLRFVAERAELGEFREAVFAVTMREQRGSFKRFCSLIGARNVTEFNYRISDEKDAHVFVGIQIADRHESGAHGQALRGTRLPHPRPDPRRAGQVAYPPPGGRQEPAGAGRAAVPLRVPRAPGRADALSRQHGAELEYFAVPLPQPGRRCRPHPDRPAGAARRDGRVCAVFSIPWGTATGMRRAIPCINCSWDKRIPPRRQARHSPPGIYNA